MKQKGSQVGFPELLILQFLKEDQNGPFGSRSFSLEFESFTGSLISSLVLILESRQCGNDQVLQTYRSPQILRKIKKERLSHRFSAQTAVLTLHSSFSNQKRVSSKMRQSSQAQCPFSSLGTECLCSLSGSCLLESPASFQAAL